MMAQQRKQKLIVLGTGFAGFSLVKSVNTDLFDVTVVSPQNHFLFTPLLPSTTVGTIEFRSIIESVRKARPEVTYYQAECTAVDLKRQKIHCAGTIDGRKFELPYDHLVIAVGAVSNTFKVPGVVEYSLFLKDLADARRIRQKIIGCLEQAANPSVSEKERKRLLHFVVVGGGPTGVEFAAEMHDFLTTDLQKSYPQLIRDLRITLLEATDQILSTFDATLSDYALKLFKRQRIEVRMRSLVKRIRQKDILLADRSKIPYGLVVWSTGIGPTPFVRRLKVPRDAASRVLVDDYFRVKETSQLYALGDCSVIDGKPLPATAQVAQQAGDYLAKALERSARGLPVKPFRYRHFGMLAYIGSSKALADLQSIKGKGFGTWLFWRSAYFTRLVSLKNKILVVFDWLKTFIFGRDISRF